MVHLYAMANSSSNRRLQNYVLERIQFLALTLVNVTAMFYLLFAIYKILARSEDNIVDLLALGFTVASAIPMLQLARWVVAESKSGAKLSKHQKRQFAVGAHLCLWLGTLSIWFLLVPYLSQSNYQSGLLKLEEKQHASAIEHFRKSLHQDGTQWRAHYRLANTFEELANTEQAITHYWLGIHSDKTAYPSAAFNNLAYLYMSKQRYYDALDLLDKAESRLAEYKSDREAWLYRGVIRKNRVWTYLKLGLNSHAAKELELAWQLLTAAKALNDYPEIYCMRTIVDIFGNQGKEFANLCEKNAARLRGAYRELYVKVILLQAQIKPLKGVTD